MKSDRRLRYPPAVSDLTFPTGFLWGTATAAHQVEGGNSNSDWWAFENKPDSPCKEPSGTAIEHYTRYARDIALLAGLGFNTYRFSVEWARIEPSEGNFDQKELDHYKRMVDITRKSKLTPIVTLNHFTLPSWIGERGGWLAPGTPEAFERFTRHVVKELGESVTWYCTINEPGMVALGGYAGGFVFPPGAKGVDNWKCAIGNLVSAHKRARAAIKQMRPNAMVGQTHAMQEFEANAGGSAVMKYARRMLEDVFLEASADDDFIGVQTYTRTVFELPRLAGVTASIALSIPFIERAAVSRFMESQRRTGSGTNQESEIRRTQMGWEFRPQAVAATVRRAAAVFPGKPIIVTEHGVATANDAERIEFITDGLKALHAVIADGIPLKGYVHWSAFDNFEWASGYSMEFGLIAVDRTTQVRTMKPSARFLGEIARANRLKQP
jgi:beta-glucosidase